MYVFKSSDGTYSINMGGVQDEIYGITREKMVALKNEIVKVLNNENTLDMVDFTNSLLKKM